MLWPTVMLYLPLALLGLPLMLWTWIAAGLVGRPRQVRAAALATLAYPAIVVGGLLLIRLVRINVDFASLLVLTVIAGSMAAWIIFRVTRVLGLTALPIAAAPITVAAFIGFERGTHGRWYIQSESLAILLSIVVAAAVWHAIVGGTVLAWGLVVRRARRLKPPSCADCGYDLAGIASTRCPECGAPVAHPDSPDSPAPHRP